ncbi:MAG: hypothetical protein KME29_23200 [Calothrix sp. FI2-JRJ7]|jgi:CBS domain-containing protein|nr:hypothetical protein [Calothrix sp. FI2-JRJ7]
MPTVESIVPTLTFTYDTPLPHIIDVMGAYSESICQMAPCDCVYVVEQSRLLGIFTVNDRVTIGLELS